MGMNMSIFAFDTMAVVAVLFLGASLVLKSRVKLPDLTQHGDSSLGPNSVNWLAGLAFCGALLICLF
jgi:hypothetical protein